MTTQFLRNLERTYKAPCSCPTTQIFDDKDEFGSFQISKCIECGKHIGNKIYNIDHYSSADDTDSSSTHYEDELYTNSTNEVYRTPKQFRARYRVIKSKSFVTKRGDSLEFSGNISPRIKNLVRAYQHDLLDNVTVSIEEFLDHLVPTGAIHQ